MVVSIRTDTSQFTHFIADGEQVYPCRCGETHRGDYAAYDYGHHNCLHDCALLWLADRAVICPLCGASWYVRGEPITEPGMVAINFGLDEAEEDNAKT